MIYVLLILSLIFNVLFIAFIAFGIWFFSKTLKSNFALQDQNSEYKQFLEFVTEALVEDTIFLRSEFVQRFGTNIPEVADINKQIISFENRIIAIRKGLEQYKLVDRV